MHWAIVCATVSIACLGLAIRVATEFIVVNRMANKARKIGTISRERACTEKNQNIMYYGIIVLALAIASFFSGLWAIHLFLGKF